eukprot:4288128-Pleurochrysis_carterae.AAC.1
MFTTLEYKHEPQEQVPGVVGIFSPAENPHYNPRDIKPGSKTFVGKQSSEHTSRCTMCRPL